MERNRLFRLHCILTANYHRTNDNIPFVNEFVIKYDINLTRLF